MKKIGIITFHNSYNCGSMLESFAIYKKMREIDKNSEIINFTSEGQIKLYNVFFPNTNLKNIIKNIVILPFARRIKINNEKYEEFKNKNMKLSDKYTLNSELSDENYSVVVAGSDQIWNTTIEDFDDAYFLNWVNNARKVAYSPSFGSKNILKYSNCPEKYRNYLLQFDSLSIREINGQKWIKELCGRDSKLLIDPTLLLTKDDYEKIEDDSCTPKEDYIFFYCPGFKRELCKFVKEISKKYNMKVICWSTKSYATKFIWTYGFKLPKFENPSVYLSLIKHAKIVFTTSYHGTIFSTIYKKSFFTLKNGDMYGDDDRVKTMLKQINLESRLIEPLFNASIDYLDNNFYDLYDKTINNLKKEANDYIKDNISQYK